MAKKHNDTVEKALESGDNPSPEESQEIAQEARNIYEALAMDDEESDDLVEIPSGEDEEPAAQATEEEVEEPLVEETPQPSSKKGEDPQPVAPQKPEAPVQPSAEQIKQREEEAAARRLKLAEDLEKNFSGMLTEEDRDALMTEPEKVLPRLMAQASLHTLEQFRQTMGQELPQHLNRLTAEQKAAQELEEKFYSRWPKLRDADKGTVERVVKGYVASAAQGVTPEQVIEEAGAMAMVALRIPVEESVPQKTVQPQKSQPFTPAAPGGTVQRKVGALPARNAFETLAEEFLEEDLS